MSEGAIIVAVIGVSLTFFATAGGAIWALASRLSTLAQRVEDLKAQIETLETERGLVKAELDKVASQLAAEVRSVREEAEVRRTEDVARWLSFTEKLATITGLLSAHPTPR